MGKQVLKKPEVWNDLLSLADFISHDSLSAASRFLDAAETAFAFLAEHSEIGTLCQFKSAETRGLRQWRVAGYEKHLIFYRPIDDGIEVIRVIHAARDIPAILDDTTV
ncbi:MAG TPA: type II toxin-antitoxin system RelE/ParE family toxin [Pirellulales bacterium]|nr:type II toxin-antitoxin system RelE/ParE family toxin [Pirellulales bacterium]